jgi:hypothetical protein
MPLVSWLRVYIKTVGQQLFSMEAKQREEYSGIGYRLYDPVFESWQGQEFSIARKVQAAFDTRTLSCRGLKLTIHFHLVPRLRMSGTIHLPPLYAFMTWIRTASLFYFNKFFFFSYFLPTIADVNINTDL